MDRCEGDIAARKAARSAHRGEIEALSKAMDALQLCMQGAYAAREEWQR